MKNRIYNYYVLSPRFNGRGKGFAVGFDEYLAARIFATYFLLGTGNVVSDYTLEYNFPTYYHNLISHTS